MRSDAQALRHPDQIGERIGEHLAHDVAAMKLHDVLSQFQFVRNLLIQQAGNDLPRRPGLVADLLPFAKPWRRTASDRIVYGWGRNAAARDEPTFGSGSRPCSAASTKDTPTKPGAERARAVRVICQAALCWLRSHTVRLVAICRNLGGISAWNTGLQRASPYLSRVLALIESAGGLHFR